MGSVTEDCFRMNNNIDEERLLVELAVKAFLYSYKLEFRKRWPSSNLTGDNARKQHYQSGRFGTDAGQQKSNRGHVVIRQSHIRVPPVFGSPYFSISSEGIPAVDV